MIQHQVSVDREVFEFVQNHAEPLIDTFNSTLKRLLNIKNSSLNITNGKSLNSTDSRKSTIPAGTPKALDQILNVILLVLNGNSRNSATHIVATENNVAPQTVIDKYCRQLNLTASKFDYLLSEPDLNKLREILKNKFKTYDKEIDIVLN